MLKKLVSPKFIIPVILMIGVVAALLAFGNVNKILALMTGFNRIYLAWFFLAMIAYTVVRGYQWHILLRGLGIEVPLRAQIFAFLMGEMTKSLPIGNYFQNYILQRSRGEDFGRTSAASTIVILTEVVISLIGCVIIGVGGWPWIRPLIVVGVCLAVAGAFLFAKLHDPSHPPEWMQRRKWARKLVDEFNQFREGAADLMQPRVMAQQAACSALYLTIAGTGLWLVIVGLGLTGISYPSALAVYFFSLAVSLILPLPIDFGAVEISGTGALLAYGLSKSAAVGVMLINRFLSLLSAFAIGLVGMVVFHDELAKALRERPKDKKGKKGIEDEDQRPDAQDKSADEGDNGKDEARDDSHAHPDVQREGQPRLQRSRDDDPLHSPHDDDARQRREQPSTPAGSPL